MSKISIIIPSYNESKYLPLLLSDLSIINEELEIIIVDCNSEDKTIDIANIYGAKIYNSKEKNRGLQLNIGAKKSKGEWLFFLHADSRLNKNWLRKIKSVIKNGTNFIYFFKFRINNKKIIYRFLEILVNLRSILLKNPYGDQGLIINRKTYLENEGYRKIPVMEDIDFIRRLKNKKDLKMLPIPIFTSSRKWEKSNLIFQSFNNWNLRRRWLKGESIKSIYTDYYK